MNKKKIDPPSWMNGLRDYYQFIDHNEVKTFLDLLISVYYSDNLNNSIKNLCMSDSGNEDDKLSRFNFYFRLLEDKDIDFLETFSIMRKRVGTDFLLDILHKYIRYEYDIKNIIDGFSRGQVASKVWLVNELEKIDSTFENILIYAGWCGQLVLFLEKVLDFEHIRIIDKDPVACAISDRVINNHLIKDWRVKSSCANIEDIEQYLHHCNIPLINRAGDKIMSKFSPDLIINTSAEHMNEDWFYNIKKDCTIAIQSNNLFNIKEHTNCVTSIDAMKKKFKMNEIFYEGELQLQGYKRFMLIGKK